MSAALPPPIRGTAVVGSVIGAGSPAAPHPPTVPATLPMAAAWGAIGVLTASLIVSKYLLDAVIDFDWPVAAYVALLALVGYGPPVWWCRFASNRWATGDLGTDIGLTPRFADLGWGPVIWLGAIAAQVVVGLVVVALGVPLVSNTEGLDEISADRTYVVSLVITAVIAAPIVEEMVFRGVVMRGLRSRLPLVAVIVVQGLLFGVAHIDPVRGAGNVGLVMVLSGVGIAFGIGVALLGRIGPSIVAHAIFNGAVLLLVLTGVADRLQDDVSSGSEQIGVVDQSDVTESGRECETNASLVSAVGVELIDGCQRGAVEHRDVVERGHRLVLDHATRRRDHLARR